MTEAYKQTIGDKHYTVRFVSRQHIKDKPTEANPSPIRVILVGEIEYPQGMAFTQDTLQLPVMEGIPCEDLEGCPHRDIPHEHVPVTVSEKGEVEALLTKCRECIAAIAPSDDGQIRDLILSLDAYLSRGQG